MLGPVAGPARASRSRAHRSEDDEWGRHLLRFLRAALTGAPSPQARQAGARPPDSPMPQCWNPYVDHPCGRVLGRGLGRWHVCAQGFAV